MIAAVLAVNLFNHNQRADHITTGEPIPHYGEDRPARLDQRLMVKSPYRLTKKKNDAFSNPELDILLRQHQISHLYVAGLDASYCVNCTIRGGLNRENKVTVIQDAVISAQVDRKAEMIGQFRELGAPIISVTGFPEAH